MEHVRFQSGTQWKDDPRLFELFCLGLVGIKEFPPYRGLSTRPAFSGHPGRHVIQPLDFLHSTHIIYCHLVRLVWVLCNAFEHQRCREIMSGPLDAIQNNYDQELNA